MNVTNGMFAMGGTHSGERERRPMLRTVVLIALSLNTALFGVRAAHRDAAAPVCFALTGTLTTTNHIYLFATSQVDVVSFSVERRGSFWRIDLTNNVTNADGVAVHKRWLTTSYTGSDVFSLARLSNEPSRGGQGTVFTSRQSSTTAGAVPIGDWRVRLLWYAFALSERYGATGRVDVVPPWDAVPTLRMGADVNRSDVAPYLPLRIRFLSDTSNGDDELALYTSGRRTNVNGLEVPRSFILTVWDNRSQNERRPASETVGEVDRVTRCSDAPLLAEAEMPVQALDYRFGDEGKAMAELIYTNTRFVHRDNPQLQAIATYQREQTRYGVRRDGDVSRPLRVVLVCVVAAAVFAPAIWLSARKARRRRPG